MFIDRILTLTLISALLAGCDKPAETAAPVRPVRTTIVERPVEGETISLAGQVRAKDQVNLAFRLDGRMISRPVNVGDVLTPGQVVATLDPQNQQNALQSAQANLATAEAALTQAQLTFSRQQDLIGHGWTPRAKFDEAQQALAAAQAQVESGEAQVRIAQDQLSYTKLSADASGVVVAVGAEAGEVVRAGQMVVQVAQQGGRDAVFDVPEELIRNGPRDPIVELTLTNDPQVRATGRVREVAPQADAATRTFQVKVGIINAPEGMRLGSTVTGRIKLPLPPGLQVPASALTQVDGQPAVWVVDPQRHTVSLRNIAIARHDAASVVVSQGLETGDLVVTAGVQTLHPGQNVRLLGASS